MLNSTKVLLASLLLATACSDQDPAYPWLSELNDKADAKHSGKRLMALPEGLHGLEPADATARTILVGIHGYGSEGYEWVYPLKTIDNDENATYFYRWNYNGCPTPAAGSLTESIGSILAESPGVDLVRLVGHSYGGVLAATIVKEWNYATPVEIHVVAAPLAGIGALGAQCDYSPPDSIGENVRFFQWRTQHSLDGAFKDMETDPQIIDLADSTVTRLPETYNGHRLGHNWSISWVADTLKSTYSP
jgi:pimeloyl-ACP methyl ester carboxylesterase